MREWIFAALVSVSRAMGFDEGSGAVGMYLRTVVESIRLMWYVGPSWIIVVVLTVSLATDSIEREDLGRDMEFLLNLKRMKSSTWLFVVRELGGNSRV